MGDKHMGAITMRNYFHGLIASFEGGDLSREELEVVRDRLIKLYCPESELLREESIKDKPQEESYCDDCKKKINCKSSRLTPVVCPYYEPVEPQEATCQWKPTKYAPFYATKCGPNKVVDNGFKYCPYCGKPIKVIE